MTESTPKSEETDKIRRFSERIYREHIVSAIGAKRHAERAENTKKHLHSIKAAKKLLAQLDEGDPALDVLPSVTELEEQEEPITEEITLRVGNAQHDKGWVGGVEWGAKLHLVENREAYEQAAIEDANEAGHDVNFGGENYPAKVAQERKPT